MTIIQSVRDFGGTHAFDTFSWNGQDARRYNVVYGWNGSGKSTLARAMRLLDQAAEVPEGLDAFNFRIKTSSGVITRASVDRHQVNVRVFNKDFVQENLLFDQSQAKSIVIVGDDKDRKHDLEDLERRILEKESVLKSHKDGIAEIPAPQSILTDCARQVVAEFTETSLAADQYNPRRYTRRNVQMLLDDGTITEASVHECIIADEVHLNTLRQTVQARQSEVRVDLPDLDDVAAAVGKANAILVRSVHVKAIARLEEDPDLAGWVRKGMKLHDDRDLRSCAFCGGGLPPDLIQRYREYFTDEVAAAEADIAASLEVLESLLSDLSVSLPDSSILFHDLAEQYAKVRPVWESDSRVVREICAEVVERLHRRHGQMHLPGSQQELVRLPEGVIARARSAAIDIRKLCRLQSSRITAGQKARTEAARKLELHTIASLLVERSYFSTVADLQRLKAAEESVRLSIAADRRHARQIRADLRNTVIALDEINSLIAGFLGPGQIELQEKDEAGYRLESRGLPNRFPSEGEKSVIGLAYFITKLREEGCDPKKTIVVLDDPVDSQDSNFLFRTSAVLRRRLEQCAQVFILTHNYEFFNLLRDWLNAEDDSNLYWMEIGTGESGREARVEDLPALLREYKTEYQYLFSKLIEYKRYKRGLDGPLVPNVARKVLEYFASFKWSCSSRDRLDNIVYQRYVQDGDEEKRELGGAVLKFLNEYSHGRDFTRPVTAAVLEAQEIAKAVLDFIAVADPDHFETLQRRIRRS